MRSRSNELYRRVLIRDRVELVADSADRHNATLPLHRRPGEMPEIIFGVEPVREMLAAAPSHIRALYVKQGTEARFEREIQAVREVGGPVSTLSNKDLARIAGSGGRHQGIIAVLREFSYTSLEQVLADRPDPLLLVDGVTDPRNLGAMLRAAECAGIGSVILAKDRVLPIANIVRKVLQIGPYSI